MPTSPTQAAKNQKAIQREVFEHAAATHTRLGRHYLRAGRNDLANDEAECARRALKRARELAQ